MAGWQGEAGGLKMRVPQCRARIANARQASIGFAPDDQVMNAMLNGKVALVTGAAGGIGRAIALAAAREGASLVLGDIQEAAGEQLLSELREAGFPACFRRTDVSSTDDIGQLLELARKEFSSPDIAFANAGIEGPSGAPWDCSEADFMRVIDVNLMGTWRTMVSVLPDMVERGAGAIVATASVAGLVGAGGLAAYVTSKHAVMGLVKSLAIDTASRGVRVNAVCPGMIETDMVDRLAAATPGFREALLALKPMGRLGEAQEVAEAAIWLASDKASFITGHGMTIDGGYTAQ